MATTNYERWKNAEWAIVSHDTNPTAVADVHQALLAVLMDIRGELRRMRGVLECHNTLRIPHILDRIEAYVREPEKQARKAVRKAKVLRRKAV